MSDLIKRQDAIGKIKDWMKFIGYSHSERNVMECTIQMLEELPSAEPEIIRCKDCKYSEESDEREWLLCHFYGDQWNEDEHWCSHAERRTDESNKYGNRSTASASNLG